jgi:Tfp pilus assembly protein FimT
MAGIAVVGVMVTVGAPTMTDFLACQRLNSTARAVASDLQLLRMQAVSQQVNHEVAFASNPSTYTLSRWDTGTSAYVPLKAAQTFEQGVDLTSADGAIVFGIYGAPPAGIIVTLDSPQCGREKTVSVNTIGRIKIL